MLNRFVLGAIVGGIAVWTWREELRQLADTKGRTVRLAAADALQSAQSTAGQIFDSARDQVTATLLAGQDAVRPAATAQGRR
jgi:hypothetical protein